MKQYNKDELIGYNLPRAGYAISGTDWALENGKDAPMIINLNTPGTFGDDWINTYGASLDSFLSIVDGFKVVESISTITVGGIYADAFPNTKTDNIWSLIQHSDSEVPVQQVQYMVSGGNIDEGRDRVDVFGNPFNARGLCMRTPMMACGYGRTKDMLPLFPKEFDERKNDEDGKLDRSQWKTGTVDLRWDERRNVWGAWQDLIADKEDKGLGTTVFSTNPDLDKGFPYLKGKLQDVWWVRQPDSLKGTDGKIEGQQTAEIMTHLKHKFFDESTDGSAKLETVFIIPHKDESEEEDACHKKGDERTLGDETTGDSLGIDIRTTVHFWKETEVDGPIKFGDKKTDLEDKVACINEDACLFTGEMIFLDEAIQTCASRDASESTSFLASVEEGKPPCEWVPAVRIDECELVGGHFGTFYENDEVLANRVNALCTEVNGYSETISEEIKANFDVVLGGIGDACGSAAGLAQDVNGAFAGLASETSSAINDSAGQIIAIIFALIIEINDALAACGCEFGVSQLGEQGFAVSVSAPKVPIPLCGSVLTTPISEFDCGQCVTIELKAPCSKESKQGEATFTVGAGCDGNEFPRPTYDDKIGRCQANDAL